MKLRWIALWTPVIAFMIVVYAASGQELVRLPEQVGDKLVHGAMYFGFGLLCLRAFHAGWGPLRGRPSLGAWLLTVAYAALDEWHQASVPGRVPSVEDWVADSVGGTVAILVVCLLTTVGASRRAVSGEHAADDGRLDYDGGSAVGHGSDDA